MKRMWIAGCLTLLAAVCMMAQPPGPPPHGGGWFGGPGARFGIMPFGGEAVVTGAPYSAVQTTQMVQKLSDGNTIVEKQQSNVYRDSQGRVRIEHSFPARPGSTNQ